MSACAEACALETECDQQRDATAAKNNNIKHCGDSLAKACTMTATCEWIAPGNRVEGTDEIAVDCAAAVVCAKPDVATEENATAVMSPRADDDTAAASLQEEMPWLSKTKRL